MHHAAAQHLEPIIALAHFHGAAFPAALDIHFGRWFGKGEMRGAEAGFHLGAEKDAEKLFQNPFQLRHRNIAVNRQPFDLMEHRRVGLVVIGAVDATGADDADGRALRLERADLHRAGMGAQHERRAIIALGAVHVKRIHLGAGGMMAGDIERVEIIPIGFDARALGHAKAHIGKDCLHLFGHLRHRVQAALAQRAGRQADIQPFRAQACIKRGIGQGCFLGGNGAG